MQVDQVRRGVRGGEYGRETVVSLECAGNGDVLLLPGMSSQWLEPEAVDLEA